MQMSLIALVTIYIAKQDQVHTGLGYCFVKEDITNCKDDLQKNERFSDRSAHAPSF